MADNYDIASGYLGDLYSGTGLSGRIKHNNYGREIEFDSPSIDLATVTDVKNFHNINTTEYDDYIEGFIEDALIDIEQYTGRTIVKRAVTAYYKRVYTDLWLPYPDHNSITSITSIDDYGTETTLTTDDYTVLGNKQYYISFNDYTGSQIKIVYDAGYSVTLSEIPRSLRDAIIQQVMVYYSQFADNIDQIEFNPQTMLNVRAESLAKRYKVST